MDLLQNFAFLASAQPGGSSAETPEIKGISVPERLFSSLMKVPSGPAEAAPEVIGQRLVLPGDAGKELPDGGQMLPLSGSSDDGAATRVERLPNNPRHGAAQFMETAPAFFGKDRIEAFAAPARRTDAPVDIPDHWVDRVSRRPEQGATGAGTPRRVAQPLPITHGLPASLDPIAHSVPAPINGMRELTRAADPMSSATADIPGLLVAGDSLISDNAPDQSATRHPGVIGLSADLRADAEAGPESVAALRSSVGERGSANPVITQAGASLDNFPARSAAVLPGDTGEHPSPWLVTPVPRLAPAGLADEAAIHREPSTALPPAGNAQQPLPDTTGLTHLNEAGLRVAAAAQNIAAKAELSGAAGSPAIQIANGNTTAGESANSKPATDAVPVLRRKIQLQDTTGGLKTRVDLARTPASYSVAAAPVRPSGAGDTTRGQHGHTLADAMPRIRTHKRLDNLLPTDKPQTGATRQPIGAVDVRVANNAGRTPGDADAQLVAGAKQRTAMGMNPEGFGATQSRVIAAQPSSTNNAESASDASKTSAPDVRSRAPTQTPQGAADRAAPAVTSLSQGTQASPDKPQPATPLATSGPTTRAASQPDVVSPGGPSQGDPALRSGLQAGRTETNAVASQIARAPDSASRYSAVLNTQQMGQPVEASRFVTEKGIGIESVRITSGEPPANTFASTTQGPLQDVSVPQFKLPPAPGSERWNQALGERVVLMLRADQQVARLTLNPEHLGPLEVQVRVRDEQAQVWMQAHTPQAREALENAMPRLREMLAEQGLDLAREHTGDQRQAQNSEGRGSAGTSPQTGAEQDASDQPASKPGNHDGLLDRYI